MTGQTRDLKSRIVAVGAGNEQVWRLLKRHEHRLKRYWITQVELAFDVRNCVVEDVQPRLLTLTARLDKRWHQRGHLHLIIQAGRQGVAGLFAWYAHDLLRGTAK